MEACVAPGAGGSSLWRREVQRGMMGHEALSFLERALRRPRLPSVSCSLMVLSVRG